MTSAVCFVLCCKFIRPVWNNCFEIDEEVLCSDHTERCLGVFSPLVNNKGLKEEDKERASTVLKILISEIPLFENYTDPIRLTLPRIFRYLLLSTIRLLMKALIFVVVFVAYIVLFTCPIYLSESKTKKKNSLTIHRN